MRRTIPISRRLTNIASFITKGAWFADIGSDHAYLTCYVCLEDEEAKAVAVEVAKAPLQNAEETVNRYGLSEQVDVRLGSGLQVLQTGEVHTVVLAGMGGALIKTILDDGWDHMTGVERIIAQPNVDAPEVRDWLQKHGYTITDEVILEENSHIYEIIVADQQQETTEMTDKQLFFGPHLLRQKPEPFYQKWCYEAGKLRQIVEQITQAPKPDTEKLATFKQELAWIEEVLSDDNDHAKC